MAGDMIQLSASAFATAMANRVKRERERIARLVDDLADEALGSSTPQLAQGFRELAEAIRSGEGGGVQLVPVTATPGTEDQGESDVVDDNEELPAVHHRDDFEDADSILIAQQRAQALRQGRGGAEYGRYEVDLG